MKYFKIIFLLILFSSALNASFYLGQRNYCIDDFYSKDGNFYYLKTSNSTWYYTTEKIDVNQIIPSFVYDTNSLTCNPPAFLILGMDIKDFNFLLGLIGLIFGGVFMFFTTQAFMFVGGRR